MHNLKFAIRPSSVHGYGCFIGEDLSVGTEFFFAEDRNKTADKFIGYYWFYPSVAYINYSDDDHEPNLELFRSSPTEIWARVIRNINQDDELLYAESNLNSVLNLRDI